jgi:hypothetical protein
VPDEEAAAAREMLGLAPLGERPREGGSFGALAGTGVAVLFGLAAYTAPHLLPVLVGGAVALWIWLRRARTAARE